MSTLFCPIAALAMNVIIQILVFRLRRGARYFRSIVEGFLAGAFAFVIFEAAFALGHFSLIDILTRALFVDFPIYLALSYCAYSFIQLGQTSIRIRMYSEIASSPDGINVNELKREYDDNALMQARLRRLIESGDIVQSGGRYSVGRKRFLYISNILFAAKLLLLGKSSEFESST